VNSENHSTVKLTAATGQITNRTDIHADRDKSFKEDHIMRLSEFTDPKVYTITAAEEMAIYKEIEACLRAFALDDAQSHLRKKHQTEKPISSNTV
jgi:hypothetical protein